MSTLRLLVGSVLVYLVVACGNAATPFVTQALVDAGVLDDAQVDAHGSPVDATSSTSHDAHGLVDAVTNPVGDAKADPSSSGSRLKLQYYVGSDGSKTFAQVLDTMTGQPCSYATAADGMSRCLPLTSAIVGALFFADSACSQPAAESTCGAPSYISSTSGSCGSTQTHIFQVGSQVTGYEKIGTSCTAVSSLPSGYAFYGLGAEVDASTFIAGSLQSL